MSLKWFEIGIPNITWKDVLAFELISIKISFVKSITPITFYENFISSNVSSNGGLTRHQVLRKRAGASR